MDKNESFYREIKRIRRFEETVLENFQKGVFSGTAHTYLGQEANAVGVLTHIQAEDVVFSNHRCHGHFLAYGGEMRELFAEMMGRSTGVCAGRGGSQHLHWRNFYSNGIQGGIVPIATGMAFAENVLRKNTIAVCFLGDGTLGQGVVYEALNIASLWELPIFFVLENNKIAQTTSIDQALAGSIIARFEAFGIHTSELDSFDVREISEKAETQMEAVRTKRTPQALILHTQRLGPHSKGDDTRDPQVLEELKRERNPLILQGKRLPISVKKRIDDEVNIEVREAYEKALHDPMATELRGENLASHRHGSNTRMFAMNNSEGSRHLERSQTVLENLNSRLHEIIMKNEHVVILGEDVLDPYGGAFKMTKGLSTKNPERVRTTPISEAGMIGVAAGLAMRGMRPVVEIMFGDFITLAADQIINHIAKFNWMYNDQVKVPVLIRTPMGGRRRYGPTHSQTLEKIFLGVPGLRIVAPCDMGSPGGILDAAICDENPVLFIENKLLYSLPVQSEKALTEFRFNQDFSKLGYPYFELTIRGAPEPSLTLVTYGYMTMLAREAALKLAYENEIFVKIISLTQLSPFELTPVIEAVGKTGLVLTLEEGTRSLGWGAEILAQVSEALGKKVKNARRLAAADLPIPAASALEDAVLPGIQDIVETAIEMVGITTV